LQCCSENNDMNEEITYGKQPEWNEFDLKENKSLLGIKCLQAHPSYFLGINLKKKSTKQNKIKEWWHCVHVQFSKMYNKQVRT